MKENKIRVLTAIGMIVVFAPLIFIGGYFYFALCILLAGIACFELANMHNIAKGKPLFISIIVAVFGSISSSTLIFDTLTFKYNILIYTLLIMMLILLIICLISKKLNFTDAFYYLGCICYGGIPFGFMGCIRCLYGTSINPYGIVVYMYLLCCSMLTDVAAYEVGIRLGKHKLAPILSPKKSVEGAIGGTIIGGLLSSAILIGGQFIFDFSLFAISNIVVEIIVIILLSFVLSIVSQVGDLLASKLKREYGIKDYGTIFPGHGGVMDRFDSAILTTIVFVIILIIFVL